MRVRKSARAIVLNKENRIFLFQYKFTNNCPEVYYRNPIYTLKSGEKVQSVEKFFLVALDNESFSFEHWTESEKKRMRTGKWWSVEEIEKSEDEFFTKDIIRIMTELFDGKIPEEPLEIA